MVKSIQRIESMGFRDVSKLSVLLIVLLTGCTGGYTLWGASDDVVYREEVFGK